MRWDGLKILFSLVKFILNLTAKQMCVCVYSIYAYIHTCILYVYKHTHLHIFYWKAFHLNSFLWSLGVVLTSSPTYHSNCSPPHPQLGRLGHSPLVTLLALLFIYLFIFVFLPFSWAAPLASGGSQARGQIGAVASGLRQSRSNAGSEPWPTERGQGSNPQPHGSSLDSFTTEPRWELPTGLLCSFPWMDIVNFV